MKFPTNDGTYIGTMCYEYLKNPDSTKSLEAAMYMAMDKNLKAEYIKRCVDDYNIVLIDRFLGSAYAYQEDISFNEFRELNNFVLDKAYPDLRIYFDIRVEDAIERIFKRDGIPEVYTAPDFHITKSRYEKYFSAIPAELHKVTPYYDQKLIADEIYRYIINKIKRMSNFKMYSTNNHQERNNSDGK